LIKIYMDPSVGDLWSWLHGLTSTWWSGTIRCFHIAPGWAFAPDQGACAANNNLVEHLPIWRWGYEPRSYW